MKQESILQLGVLAIIVFAVSDIFYSFREDPLPFWRSVTTKGVRGFYFPKGQIHVLTFTPAKMLYLLVEIFILVDPNQNLVVIKTERKKKVLSSLSITKLLILKFFAYMSIFLSFHCLSFLV